MAAAVPVADVGSDPLFAAEMRCQIGDFSLVEYGVDPFLAGYDVFVEGSDAESGEKSHQFERSVVAVGRNESVVGCAVADESRHRLEVADGVDKRLFLAGRNHEY